MDAIIEKLLQNSKSCQLACIEIHNKPVFPFRYETCVVLNINSWELLLKAYILKYHPEVKIINSKGTTKPFEECLAFTGSQLGKEFLITQENIQKLYEFRCNIVHFYQDDISVLTFALLSKNVLLYSKFLLSFFKIDIANETNLILLPIGFKGPVSPLDFLSNASHISQSSEAVQQFVKSIAASTHLLQENGLDESILYSFKMSLINESRIKNADIVAAISKDKSVPSVYIENVLQKVILVDDMNAEGVKIVKIEEDNLFKTIYTETHDAVIKKAKTLFSDFKSNEKFNKILKSLRNNPMFHKVRYLNFDNPRGGYKNYYSQAVYNELDKHYTLREVKKQV
jgi:effector-binding domain-containing protein